MCGWWADGGEGVANHKKKKTLARLNDKVVLGIRLGRKLHTVSPLGRKTWWQRIDIILPFSVSWK